MKITLINPRIHRRSFVPLGILYIAGVLEKSGFKVKVYDADPDDDSFIDEIASDQPEIIGLTLVTAQVQRTKEIIDRLKEKNVKSLYVLGGIHPTAASEKSLKYFGADLVIIGEGEITFLELCKRIREDKDFFDVRGLAYFKDGDYVQNPERELTMDLDSLPMPARHLLDFNKYLIPPGVVRGFWLERSTGLMSSRGCPYYCIYCGSHLVFGRKFRQRSVSNMIAEIEQLVKKYKINGFWFVDDTFTINKAWILEFCQKLKAKDFKLKWACQARVNTIDEEVLKAMKAAGCVQIDYGVESGSPEVLKIIKKAITPEMVKKTFCLTRKLGIRSAATFMLGLPGEKAEDIRQTLKLAKEIKADWTSFFFVIPYPGTELLEMAKNNKWIKDKDLSHWIPRGYPVMEINFSREELIKIRSKFQNRFILNNYALFLKNPRFVLKIISLFFRYPGGLLAGFKEFLRIRTLDDFTFAFLEYYRKKRKI